MSKIETDDVLLENMSLNVIAVIDMRCKFSKADSVEDFWRILDAGQSMLSESLSRRFPTHDYQRNTKKMICFDNFLNNIASFDHRFFKKFSRETASMNPQQRLLLKIFY